MGVMNINMDIYKRIYLVLVCLLGVNCLISSQGENLEINFSNVSVNEGLSNNFINDISQDSMGFIWIATTEGLCRYDAKDDFKVFQENGELALNSSNIRSLLSDSKNKLWVGTRLGGLTCFDQKTRTSKAYMFDANDPNSISNNEILSIFEDSKGRIWAGTEHGLNLYLPETDNFISWTPDEQDPTALQKSAILEITEDSRGFIWVGCWAGGLNLILDSDSEDPLDISFRNFSINTSIAAQNVWAITEDHKNRLWLGTHGGGLFMAKVPENASNKSSDQNWDLEKIHFDFESYLSMKSNTIDDVHIDKDNNLWLATTSGLHYLSSEYINQDITSMSPLEFKVYLGDSADEKSIAGSVSNKIFQDKNNNFWVGTMNGLSRFNLKPIQIEYFPIDVDNYLEQLNGNFYVENDSIVIIAGLKAGLYELNLKTKITSKFNIKNYPNDTQAFTINIEDNKLIVGTDKGVLVIDRNTREVQNFIAPQNIIKTTNNLFSKSLFIDDNGLIYLSTEYGLVTLDRTTGIYKKYNHDTEDPSSISDNSVNEIHQTNDGTIWLATYKGLNRIVDRNEDELKFESYLNKDRTNDNALGTNQVICLKELNGILYIGTTYGVSHMDLSTNEISTAYHNSNKSYVFSLETDLKNNLWYSTSDGITSYNCENNSYRKYDDVDGLIDNTFRIITSKSSENYIYFGSQKGISRVNIANSQQTKNPPITHITEVKLINRNEDQNLNLIGLDRVTLPGNNYYISLKFIGLDYDRMEKTQYAYKLEGFDEEWFYPKKNIPAVYTNLKPGNYTFKAKTANNEGVWSETAEVEVIKEPSLLEKPWVRLAFLLFTLFVLLTIISAYTSSIKKNNLQLQTYNDNLNKEIRERKKIEEFLTKTNMDLQQFAYGASHDLQEPLRNIGNAVGLLQRKNQFDDSSNEYVEIAVDGVKRMSSLIENLLKYAKSGSQSVTIEEANLNQIVQDKVTDLSQMITDKNAKVTINDLPNINCEINQIGIVFYNLINNGIKFNKNPKPEVIVSHEEQIDRWIFFVKDNGIGISKKYQQKIFSIFTRLENKKEYEGTGIGLSLCQKIVNRHNGEIWVESKENEGATFYFSISKNLNPA